ncbi:MAG: molecular chaperone DnaK, partial [Eubacterium sp.]|nr:molecular chaperone DnaK [Eubacterium sp.]
FQTEKALNEVGDKVDQSEKDKVQAEIDKVKAILERTTPENMSDADIDELKAAKESLMTSSQAVFSKMYEQMQGQGGAGPDMSGMGGMGGQAGPAPDQGSNSSSDDGVVDADFREV